MAKPNKIHKTKDKTKEQLINELVEMRQRITELEKSEADRKRAEEALRESDEKYRRIFETSKDVLYLTSREGKFIDINQAGVDLFGYSKEELLNIDLAKHLYVNSDDRKRFQEMIEKDGFVKDYEVQFKKKDKTKIYVSITANVRKDRNGEVLGYEGIIRDITEKRKVEEIKHLYEEAKALAERDALTYVFNHRRINEFLENEIERAKRGGNVFSIMMLDVDDLKLINDSYGHIAGDKVLKQVATILENSSRSVDSIGRYGGDEFLMILPYTNGEKAKTIAQRISRKVEKEGLKIDEETTVPIRLSIGVATYPFDSSVAQDLISLADRSMYESKRSGKSVVSASIQEVSEFLTKERPSFDVFRDLVAAVNGKDYYTKEHSDLVTTYALSLGKKLKLPSEQMEALKVISLLHDIGKIGIPDRILRKPGPLKREEFEIIKQHPKLGALMLDGPPPHREHVLGAVMFHHERYDGKGYPGRLKGEDIPLLARIIGIADAYSAMLTDRPYRKALTKDRAIEELKKGAGKQFDPDLVSEFIECLK